MSDPEERVEGFAPEQLRHLYRSVLLPRMIEEKMLVLLRQGRL
jgi:TPP-dependent pyruvate/acetoin dehydrogenase alpha subunit